MYITKYCTYACMCIYALIRRAITNAHRLRGDEELSVSEAGAILRLND